MRLLKRPSAQAGLLWFDYYDDQLVALKGSNKLSGLDSVAGKGVKLGQQLLADNKVVKPKTVVHLGPHDVKIKEGNW